MKIEINENNFTLYIENDSPKAAPGTVLGGNGNQIMKDRPKKIRAVIEWESTADFYLVVLKRKPELTPHHIRRCFVLLLTEKKPTKTRLKYFSFYSIISKACVKTQT